MSNLYIIKTVPLFIQFWVQLIHKIIFEPMQPVTEPYALQISKMA